jgi:hypothetical protein
VFGLSRYVAGGVLVRENRRRLLCRLGKHRWTKREVDEEPVVVCSECGKLKGGDGPNIDVRGRYGFGPL